VKLGRKLLRIMSERCSSLLLSPKYKDESLLTVPSVSLAIGLVVGKKRKSPRLLTVARLFPIDGPLRK
jgi:hypothetical protein